ncbi:hypothetical protein [Methylobacterium sp. J-070]|uniref:hypothetical protein n=1 Tax=Methylobacterium sp. J-070 TaxID=2836650 RepID=UPI001FB9A260|nr:hypothetical protein [Methylobacterium sp. J-070]MCJ2052806.1 hypothetical protein [Methylobacterium sp. J-070]
MRHHHILFAHESDEAANEMFRKLITAHADFCTVGQRSNWYYEWRHDHVVVRFRLKADWYHFATTFWRKHFAILHMHDFLEPDCDEKLIEESVDLLLTYP